MLNVHGRTIWKNSNRFLSKNEHDSKAKKAKTLLKTDETKVEIFAHICTAKNKAQHTNCQAVVGACFAATGPEHLAVKEKTWKHTKVFYSQI